MMPWPASTEVVEHLSSLQRSELLAIINGDRDTMIALRLAWVREYALAVPLSGGAKEAGELAVESLSKYAGGEVPGWLKWERARPLRLVVERTEYRVQIGYPPGVLWYRESLICGHQLNLPASVFGEKPPTRRRCGQCATEALNDHDRGTGITSQAVAVARRKEACATGNVRRVGVAVAGGVRT